MKQTVILFLVVLFPVHMTMSIENDRLPAYISPPDEIYDAIKENWQLFCYELERWENDVLNTSPDPMSSVYLPPSRGDAFINLLNMGPETAPFWLHVLLEDKRQPLINRNDGFRLPLNDRRRGFSYVLRGGEWLILPLLEELSFRADAPDTDDEQWLTEYWENAIHERCRSIFKARRAKFQRSLSADTFNKEMLHQNTEWQELRDVGILGIPLLMERVTERTADYYDYLLLTIWTMPYQLHPTHPDRPWLPLSEEMVGTVNDDPQYWVRWWEANKHRYWWLRSRKE